MKLFIFTLIIPLLIVTGYFLSMELLNTYNTQKDREMFVKTYEIVLECRKSYAANDTEALAHRVPHGTLTPSILISVHKETR